MHKPNGSAILSNTLAIELIVFMEKVVTVSRIAVADFIFQKYLRPMKDIQMKLCYYE
ncbi:MAG: hypothetical protein Q8935_06905 [Bacillota bacterium]|nr:hypothetical protein [Bacillota bacterium]